MIDDLAAGTRPGRAGGVRAGSAIRAVGWGEQQDEDRSAALGQPTAVSGEPGASPLPVAPWTPGKDMPGCAMRHRAARRVHLCPMNASAASLAALFAPRAPAATPTAATATATVPAAVAPCAATVAAPGTATRAAPSSAPAVAPAAAPAGTPAAAAGTGRRRTRHAMPGVTGGRTATGTAVRLGSGPCTPEERRSPARTADSCRHPRRRARSRGFCHQEAPQEDGEEEAPQAAEEDAHPAPQQEVDASATEP